MQDLKTLQDIIGHQFHDESLLITALSHRSCRDASNERLEFLGDAILGTVIAEMLYRRFDTMTEGKMSRIRSSLVNGEALAEIALSLNLNDYVRLGDGERKTGGATRTSILADCLEAVIAAVYLDCKFACARACILRWFETRVENLSEDISTKDAKSRLQEWVQARQLSLPHYEVTTIAGEPHCREFTVACRVDGIEGETIATASSRKRAEQIAAQKLLEFLHE